MSDSPKASPVKLAVLGVLVLAAIGVLLYNFVFSSGPKVDQNTQSQADKIADQMMQAAPPPAEPPPDPKKPPSPMRQGGVAEIGK
ncbi:MAG: hypothetical protein SFY95_01345 [Planctomycetota bacterium]|nr:hypothetical protein [Planctomycetota bacterium]